MKWIKRTCLSLLALLVISIAILAVVVSYTSDCPPPGSLSTNADSMTAAVAHCYGSPDIVRIEAVERPVPKDNEILVKVKAASVNPLDWHYMRGSPYLMRLIAGIGSPNDIRMGVDFAGEVVQVGENVSKFSVGDAVFGGRSGAFAEYVVVPEDRAVTAKPGNVSFAEAAAVPVAAVTALQALRDKGQVKPGQKVLINGASGGVGTYAVQIAKSFGAEVTGVCSERNADMVRSIGADHVIDYKTANYTDGEEKYDLIVDMIGNHSVLANTEVLTAEGRLVLVGGPKGNWIAPFKSSVAAMAFGPFVDQRVETLLAEMRADDLAVLAGLMSENKVTSVIDQTFSLQETADAIRYSETGRARGKIIVQVDGATNAAEKRIALTFDDAPKGDGPVFGGDERAGKLISALRRVDSGPVAFFVTTGNFDKPGGKERIQQYADAGHLIANHSHSHQWLHKTDTADYIADIAQAEALLDGIDNRRSWYRYPFLDEGRSIEKRDALTEALQLQGLQNGYVTVDNYDWYLDMKWQEAVREGREVNVDAMQQAYVDMLMGAVAFYAGVAEETLDTSPVHVLLLHENDVAALFIDDLVRALRNDAWSIVSPDEAYSDPISDRIPETLLTGQGRVAALAVDAGFDNRQLTHLAIEETEIDAMLAEREVFGDPATAE